MGTTWTSAGVHTLCVHGCRKDEFSRLNLPKGIVAPYITDDLLRCRRHNQVVSSIITPVS